MRTRVGQPVMRDVGLADRVAEHMKDLVLNGTLAPATRLPPERVLAEEYGVSRPVIREAVRSLVSKGLLDTRLGSGTYVRGPNPLATAESVAMQLRLHHGDLPIPYELVYETRRILEVEIAGLAAQRATTDDVAALEREIERQREAGDNYDAVVVTDAAFHANLAAATHNPLLKVLMDSMQDVMAEIRELGSRVPGSLEPGLAEHERILSAVKARDASGAAQAMQSHLEESERVLIEGLRLRATHAPADEHMDTRLDLERSLSGQRG